jgi:hypothetical protein
MSARRALHGIARSLMLLSAVYGAVCVVILVGAR